ncbi:MAG: 50S ribosomal protein L24 [Firmicutes bacterium]|nr:50S ribosomal protein L24 [Bacillota bacterium]
MATKNEKSKMHVKTGDQVVVIAGKDKGKTGKVINVDTKNGRVYVDKVNLVSRHSRPTKAAPQGGIIKKEAALDSSNVMLFCSKCNQGVRVKKEVMDDGKKMRVCAKCGASFDKE